MASTDLTLDKLSDNEWIAIQKKTFTNWVNDMLKATEVKVKDLQIDLQDGVTLITLLQVLAPGKKMPGKYKKTPRLDFHKRENLTIVFRFMLDVENIPLVNIGAMDIYQGNLKLILGLIWTLILRYQIAGPTVHEPSDATPTKAMKKKKEVSGKKLLIHWVNNILPINVSNFTTAWNNGLALSALVDYCKPGLIPNHSSLDPSNGLENIKNAMDIAEKELGVPQVMHPEDMAAEKPDELSVMTYVSGYCHQDSPGQTSLLEWTNKQIPNETIGNLSSDWINGQALGALIDSLTGGQFPEYEQMATDNPLENCQKAIERAQLLLNIKPLVSAEKFSTTSLNQLTRITYLAQFQLCKPLTESPLIDSLRVEGKGTTGGIVQQETSVLVSGQRIPKWANVTASVTTADGKQLQVRKQRLGDNSVEFSYTPLDAGEYTIIIYWNETPLSTFKANHILPVYADRCHANGGGLKNACVGKKTEFTVNCKEGGSGVLQVSVHGPMSNVVTNVHEEMDQNYTVSYTPVESGIHEITVQLNNEHIPNSPFKCVVVNPSKCTASGEGLRQVKVNEPQMFDIGTDGDGDISVKVSGPSSNVPVKIQNTAQSNYLCTYVPEETGLHVIEILLSGYPIVGSPFHVISSTRDDLLKSLPGKPLHVHSGTDEAPGNLRTSTDGVGKMDNVRLQNASRESQTQIIVLGEREEEGGVPVNFTSEEEGGVSVNFNSGVDSSPQTSTATRVCFSSTTQQAQTSNATVIVQDSSSAKVPAVLTCSPNGQHEIEFASEDMQDYTVTLKYYLKITPQQTTVTPFTLHF